jgi:hypothetical protein
MTRIDEGHKVLTTLSRTYGQLRLADANEAETRLKVIDEVLFSALGWTKDDVVVERHVNEDGADEFADYQVRTAAVTLLIEAKRVGAAFSLPSNRKRLKLGGVLSEGATGEAIRQARDYCRKLSIPFACATNGASWIIFPAVRTDGVTFDDSEARIFRDLDDVRERFIEFWELLSRERMLDGNLQDELLGRLGRDTEGPSLRELLPEPGYRLGRNALYEHIEPAVAAALTDEGILDDSEALDACYVKTSERLKYDSRLSMHLQDTMPLLGHKTTRVKSRKHSGRLDYQLKTVEARSPLRFVVLLGPVGAGKSTFLHYTQKVSATAILEHKVLWLHVDFKKATSSDNPRTFLLQQLLQIIEEDEDYNLGDWTESISKAYGPQVQAMKRGALYLLARVDPAAFDKAIAEHISKQRDELQPYVETIVHWASSQWPTFLVVDNVDQLEDLELQEKIFIEAQALARRVECNVIMSLRESTYLRHRERPAFDAFQFESFYIDPPSVTPVLSQRFGFAKKVLAGKAVRLTTEKGITVNVPDLSRFFDLVAYSLLDGDTGFMIECLAGGNIRRGLNIVREFLSSGHTNADRAIAAYIVDGNYRFPRHEVFRGAILGPFKYYNDATSLLPNLFDAKLGAVGLQLLRLQLVANLVNHASAGVTDGLGAAELGATLGRLGIPETDFLSVIQRLQDNHMIRTSDGLPAHAGSVVSVTRLGGYAIRELCGDFAYTELCCLDSVIFDKETFEEMKVQTFEIEATHDVVERLEIRRARIETYIEYLIRTEERWIVEAKRRDLPQEWQVAWVRNTFAPRTRESVAVAVRSAERMRSREISRSGSFENRAHATSPETRQGTIVSCWSDKDYAFVRDDDGVDWFAHKNEFLTEDDWRARRRNAPCAFLEGEWRGAPRAISVRVRPERSSRNMPAQNEPS